ncbi:MAG: glycerate dehydrogenase [Gammaproteobacteria bacterium]|nr:glycerate dehydrogenase [Gammaproteobacteria bacterium]
MHTGVILDLDTLHPSDLDLSDLYATLPDWTSHARTAPAEAAAHLQGAQVAVTNKAIIDAAALAQAESLRLICIAATGTNNVDLAAAAAHGIAVTNVTGYGTPSVVEHTFALILALKRRLAEHRQAAMERWRQQADFCMLDYPTTELAGGILGIVGYGELGRAAAALGRAFGMEVVIAQRPGGDDRAGRLPLSELLRVADVVSLHCPLTPATRNLIGSDELALMKPGALLINTARGGLVDEAALLAALRAGRPGGAGLDVLTEEPPRHGNPLLAPALPNLIVTPHIAWASREARQRLVDGVAANIRAFCAGEVRNRVC